MPLEIYGSARHQRTMHEPRLIGIHIERSVDLQRTACLTRGQGASASRCGVASAADSTGTNAESRVHTPGARINHNCAGAAKFEAVNRSSCVELSRIVITTATLA